MNEEQKQRPDIYLTLYEISADNDTDTVSGKLIPEKVDGYVNVQWSRVADDEKDPAYDTNYWQKATFSGLPRYDSVGDEIQYYAQESMSISNPAALDYTDVTFSDERMTEAEKASAEEHGLTVNVGSADDTSNASKAVHAGGTFENALNSKLTVNGVKLWSGLPSDFDSADLPEITVYLQRRSASESGNEWIKPEVVKKGDGDTQREDVIWNEEIGVKSAPDYGVEKQQKDAAGNVVSEVVAYTLRFEKDTDSNQWTYVINQSGLDSDGEGFEEGAEALPRYDESGRRYEYRALEAMWGLFGSDSLLGDPEGKDMAQLVIGFFDVHHGETGSFAMTNTYNGESGKLTVKKIFDQTNRVDGDNYPSVTYELYRQYAVKDSDGNDQMKPASPTPVATHTVSADEFKNGKGTVTFSFDDLEIYAPNGTYWQYCVVEREVGGYETKVTLGEAKSVDDAKVSWQDDGKSDPAMKDVDGKKVTMVAEDDTVDVTFANTYIPGKKNLAGKKVWTDYNNLFGTRPKSITLELERSSSSGMKEEVKLSEDERDKDSRVLLLPSFKA